MNCDKSVGGMGNFVQVRWLCSIDRFPVVSDSVCFERNDVCFPIRGSMCSGFVQRRGFLGCGDGDEGSVLAKVHEEKRVLG